MVILPSTQPVILVSGSSRQLVEKLRDLSSLPASGSLYTFMKQFAVRFTVLTHGLIVRTDTTDNFVADLVSHGWLKPAHSDSPSTSHR